MRDSIYDYDNIEKFAYENGLIRKYRTLQKENEESEGVEPYDYSDSEILDIFDEEIEEEYYDYLEEIYYDTLDEIKDYCKDYIDEYYNENEIKIGFDVEESRSMFPGRYASVYFKFYKCIEDEDGEFVEDEESSVYELRISDGHNNKRMSHDYEIIFNEYDENELKEILDEIAENLKDE